MFVTAVAATPQPCKQKSRDKLKGYEKSLASFPYHIRFCKNYHVNKGLSFNYYILIVHPCISYILDSLSRLLSQMSTCDHFDS